MKEAISFCEEIFREDDDTEIILEAKARQGKEWFKHLASSKIWRLFMNYTAGNRIYPKPDEKERVNMKK